MKLKCYCRLRLDERDEGEVVIYTGLSVRVRGHIIEVQRDADRRRAIVVVSVVDGYRVTGLEVADVAGAAELLAARAQRFLGHDWSVVRWAPPAGGCCAAG